MSQPLEARGGRASAPVKNGVLAVGLLLGFAALGVVGWLFFSARPSTPATTVDTGPGDVRVLAGGIHTVNHSLRPLPTASEPRPDGLPTLVQFGATWCEVCHAMEGVMARVRRDTVGRVAIVEKDVDTDPGLARRFAVRGTPTFVVLDARGRELGRLPPDLDAGRFLANLDRVIARAKA